MYVKLMRAIMLLLKQYIILTQYIILSSVEITRMKSSNRTSKLHVF